MDRRKVSELEKAGERIEELTQYLEAAHKKIAQLEDELGPEKRAHQDCQRDKHRFAEELEALKGAIVEKLPEGPLLITCKRSGARSLSEFLRDSGIKAIFADPGTTLTIEMLRNVYDRLNK